MHSRTCMLLVATGILLGCSPFTRAALLPAPERPRVEVVFCLDTTGSMSGLIAAAKAKIWSISNQIASGKPTPELKIGLIGYRDRKDAYITQVFALTEDLDAVHANLKKFSATGGGDGPESVNQALNEAVTRIKWSKDNKVLKIIFLVGDAPPHMDYPDDVKYPVTCQLAVKQNIIINTVQCGTWEEATKVWKDIAVKSEGSYVAIPRDGGDVAVVTTPFDKRLAELNTRLCKTVLCFGSVEQQRADMRKNKDAERLTTTAAASRIAYQAKNAQVSSFDLIDNIHRGRVQLEKLKKEELPRQLQGKTLKEQKKILSEMEKEREKLRKEVIKLDRDRADYIAKKKAELSKKQGASFDGEVLEVLRAQAKKFEIKY
jgi:hypothetical protein